MMRLVQASYLGSLLVLPFIGGDRHLSRGFILLTLGTV